MIHTLRLPLIGLLALLSLALGACGDSVHFEANDQQTLTPLEKSRMIVVFDEESDVDPEAEARLVVGRFGGQLAHVYRYALRGFAAELPEAALNNLRSHPQVKYITHDRVMTASAQTLPTGVDRSEGDKNSLAAINQDGGDVDVDIAVIDTGIDLDHPELNVFRQVNYARGSKNGDDGNGHGTHVAGTAAAKDNTNQVVGVAPGARLWAVRVLDNNGSGYYSDVIKGIDYVTQHADQIEVANMSLGGPGSSDGNCGKNSQDALHEAICRSVQAGVVYVVAAGNDSRDARDSIPAAYAEVITVSAVADSDGQSGGTGPSTYYGADDSLASFSNYGPAVDIAAPGVSILSTWKGGGTRSISGTSMASPHVAGAAALYIAKNGKPTNQAGTEALAEALVAAAFSQASTDGFKGDKDAYSEPLLNIGALDPSGPEVPAEPALNMTLSTDKALYNTASGENVAILTAQITNENGDLVSGLSPEDFSSDLNSAQVGLNYVETTSGVYQASLDLLSLTEGIHSVSTTVSDSQGLVATDSTSFELRESTMVSMSLAEVRYSGYGGKNSNKHYIIAVKIKDESGQAVSDATVSVLVERDGKAYGTASGVTDSQGQVQFEMKNAPGGCYQTKLTQLTHQSLVWEASADVIDSGLCK